MREKESCCWTAAERSGRGEAVKVGGEEEVRGVKNGVTRETAAYNSYAQDSSNKAAGLIDRMESEPTI